MVTIHLTILGITIFLVLLADKEGTDWMRGKKLTLTHSKITFLHRAVYVGLFSMIATGAYMALPVFSWYIEDPKFIVKMLFVLTLLVNGLFIGSLSKVATEKSYSEVDSRTKKKLLVSGAISTTCWIGAMTCGFLL